MHLWKRCVVGGGFVLAAVISVAQKSAPLHPTLLLAEYKGAMHKVVAVEKEEPVILVDGHKKTLRGNIPLSTERLAGYCGTQASITAIGISGVQVVSAMSDFGAEEAATKPRGTLGGFVEFAATITAAQNLADCYLALIAVDDSFMDGTTDRPNSQIRIRQITDLRAGEATAVEFSTSPFLVNGKARIFALLFSDGEEVSIPQTEAARQYFQRREQVIHAASVKRWVEKNRSASQPVQPLLQIPPLLASTADIPHEVTATLTISPAGTVSDVELSRRLPDPADETLRTTLKAWLFLPKIQDGVATTARVTVPLNF
jgi:TonB family protein